MSTRSTIAILYKDGTVASHYCHSDGYLEWNGDILYNHYKNVEKVKKLIDLGGMSSLLKNIDPPSDKEHSFDRRLDDVCVFYMRDRGETGQESSVFKNLDDYMKDGDFQEYDYIFNEQKEKWYLINHQTKKLVLLSTALMKSPDVDQSTKDAILAEKELKKMNKDIDKKVKKANQPKL